MKDIEISLTCYAHTHTHRERGRETDAHKHTVAPSRTHQKSKESWIPETTRMRWLKRDMEMAKYNQKRIDDHERTKEKVVCMCVCVCACMCVCLCAK